MAAHRSVFAKGLTLCFLPLGISACRAGVDRQAAEAAIFESVPFRKPLTVTLPKGLTEKDETWWRNAIQQPAVFPPIPPAGNLEFGEDFDRWVNLVEGLRLGEAVDLPRTDRHYIRYFGSPSVCLEAPGVLRIAHRRLDAVTYRNDYTMNPMGLGERQVHAVRFTYVLESAIPDLTFDPDPDERIVDSKGKVSAPWTPREARLEGSARAIFNPDSGKWELDEDQLKLNDAPIDNRLLDFVGHRAYRLMNSGRSLCK